MRGCHQRACGEEHDARITSVACEGTGQRAGSLIADVVAPTVQHVATTYSPDDDETPSENDRPRVSYAFKSPVRACHAWKPRRACLRAIKAARSGPRSPSAPWLRGSFPAGSKPSGWAKGSVKKKGFQCSRVLVRLGLSHIASDAVKKKKGSACGPYFFASSERLLYMATRTYLSERILRAREMVGASWLVVR